MLENTYFLEEICWFLHKTRKGSLWAELGRAGRSWGELGLILLRKESEDKFAEFGE